VTQGVYPPTARSKRGGEVRGSRRGEENGGRPLSPLIYQTGMKERKGESKKGRGGEGVCKASFPTPPFLRGKEEGREGGREKKRKRSWRERSIPLNLSLRD